MKELINGKTTLIIISGFLIIEALSLVGNIFPIWGNVFFVAVSSAFLILSLRDLRFGLWLVFAELFIGSQGYLFSCQLGGASISIRMAFWVILLAVWGAKLVSLLRHSKPGQKKRELKILQSSYFSYVLILAVFVGWGILNGFIGGNAFNNILFDVNGWFYLALILPLYEVVFRDKNFFYPLFQSLFAALIWLGIKTLFLVFVFSHNFYSWMDVLYNWVRDTGVGEITEMGGGMVRVFFQSHIFAVIAFFFGLIILNKFMSGKKIKQMTRPEIKKLILLVLSEILFLTVVLVSFSRSFWVGAIVATLFFLGFIWKKYNWKRMATNIGVIAVVSILSVGLFVGVVNFPGVGNGPRINAAAGMKDRAGSVSGNEAAVSSRWNLLPHLWTKITEAPILGQGFGTTITYHSNDPRVEQSTADGQYTTYAFEWGWLGIWLKLGFFGFFCYVFLLAKLILDGLIKKELFSSPAVNGIIIGIIILGTVNFFTPYLNHPLGLGFMILGLALVDRERNFSSGLTSG